ncbi:hypothetical protein ACFQ9X_21505 [Catenulispora yoronensis]
MEGGVAEGGAVDVVVGGDGEVGDAVRGHVDAGVVGRLAGVGDVVEVVGAGVGVFDVEGQFVLVEGEVEHVPLVAEGAGEQYVGPVAGAGAVLDVVALELRRVGVEQPQVVQRLVAPVGAQGPEPELCFEAFRAHVHVVQALEEGSETAGARCGGSTAVC